MGIRCVLVGSGPASVSAAEAIRDSDPTAEVTIVTAEPEGYYSRPGLAYYLAKEEPERRLFPSTSSTLRDRGIRTRLARVIELDRAAQSVRLDDGDLVGYDRLLLATGSRAIPVRLAGADLDGVTKLDDLADARDLVVRSRRARSAVILGGGITALEIVEALCARSVRVHYFMRKDRYWSNVLSPAESQIIEGGLAEHGVIVHPFTAATEIVGRNGKVFGVRTGTDDLVRADLVAVAIGVLPDKRLAEQAGLECDRGVLVDEFLRSSDRDIFAAGDVAETIEPRTGRRTVEVLWSSAVAKGRIAGHNMVAETPTPYRKSVPLNVTRLAGRHLTIIGTVGSGVDADLEGIARGDSETWRQLGDASVVEWDGPDSHLRLLLEDGSIVGAVVMGDQALSFPLQDLIGARVALGAHRPALDAPAAPVDRLLVDAWNDWQAHRA